ncbi:alpha/beta hydrolase [Marinobacterium nitratireducens]|uniref:Alpha/beta hydrolase n=1 Tax=Marinobacterium nitratireducens TaxID=518897 RepID=A0A917ZDZ9_9GAMM|nr:alpha/beta fold hydrolase [Marinobacterium nitratireducens]GGO80179.1 alpha/beta hydrolase [Marinobacterium nitratireducens]
MSNPIPHVAEKDRKRPALIHSLLEARVPLEIAGLLLSLPLLPNTPRGDGHPVLVLPGLTAGDEGTFLLRQYLASLGYSCHAWHMGRNIGPLAGNQDRLTSRVRLLAEQYQQPVSLIGWSMGGLFARYVAHEVPELVRSVTSLGSPINLHEEADNIATLVARMGSNIALEDYTSLVNEKSWHHWRTTPPVPTTAIYSRSDGACYWSTTRDPLQHDRAENVRVPGSHSGMTHNAFVFAVLADRLAQRPESWKPYRRQGFAGLLLSMSKPLERVW